MRLVRSLFVVLAAVFLAAVAREAQAQQMDPYVSCVKCHALPMQQARAEMLGHGYGAPPSPEQACSNCHDTGNHESNPDAVPVAPFFLFRSSDGPGSPLTNACVSCHGVPVDEHPYDVFPYFDATPPPVAPLAPTSVLPLFDPSGRPNQYPYDQLPWSYGGGIVCSTCHDPHDPSYPVNGRPAFLRIGSMYEQTTPLCGYCHAESEPTTMGADLFIASRSDSVRFEQLPNGDLQIEVTVRNRGNVSSNSEYPQVYWEDETGYRMLIGSLYLPSIPPDGETVAPLWWMPPISWTPGDGFFVFELPPPQLREPYFPVEFVRAMDVTPAPTNLRVTSVGPGEISLAWDVPPSPPFDLAWEVYRDGVKVPQTPVWGPSYMDYGLAPETPHVYTVVAIRWEGGFSSQPSDPVAATTTVGMVVRVPQDYPTIQSAIDAVGPGTSIHVAPGTYSEPLYFGSKYAITVKGQDANGCVLDYSSGPGMPVDLGPANGQPGNTLAGFTVRNAPILMGTGDVVAGCVLVSDSQHNNPAILGGGLVAQCVIDTQASPAVSVDQFGFLTSTNSIYLGSQPFDQYPPTANIMLLNNCFPSWFGYEQHQGSGNFSEWPIFASPGPPLSYLPATNSPTVGRGLPLEEPSIEAPNVGAFQAWEFYTPQPPATLAASVVSGVPSMVRLTWTASIDDSRMMSYLVYRSENPTFPPATGMNSYAMSPAGMTVFDDVDLVPGITYYYQVRAYAGQAGPYPPVELLSAPTNTASATLVNGTPAAVDDTLAIPEEMPGSVDVLANDSDPDGDPLVVTAITQPAHGVAELYGGNVNYLPQPDFFGTDSFSYTVSDGRGGSATANVVVTVTNVNDPPVAVDDAYTTAEDVPLLVPPTQGVLGNDADPDGDALEALLMVAPAHGTVTLNFDGSFLYTPAANFSGADSFTYGAGDRQVISAAATVTITVTAVNDPPVVYDQAVSVAEDGAIAVTLTGSDIDGDALTYAVTAGPAHGTLSGAAPSLTYTPAANYNGPDSFTFTAGDGNSTSTPATVTISLAAVNDLPVANAGLDQIGLVGQELSFSGAGSSDVEGPLASYSWSWGDGTANGSGAGPTHAWTAAGTFTVTLTVTDESGATATDTLVVTVSKVNLALNRAASASTTLAGTTADMAVDGATATFWLSRTTGNQWVRVDLGTATSISNVKVSWPAAYYAKSFKIQTSTDNKKWTSVYETTAGNGSLTNRTFTPASARYVRVYCTKAIGTSYGVAELEVYQ